MEKENMVILPSIKGSGSHNWSWKRNLQGNSYSTGKKRSIAFSNESKCGKIEVTQDDHLL
ncbi:hypothetical protein [Fredinandcohnia onubensis]|uniref:hypothetical protein n=1 Tax=Fredinandcohnia onubensis TaxID=1571209 RepID=UPI000C0BF61B|nr:hypothetical protein [Fredinandcohnia onubensis]